MIDDFESKLKSNRLLCTQLREMFETETLRVVRKAICCGEVTWNPGML
jgi:hypothetical protein